MRIVGYCDRPSVAPGEVVRFFVSCEEGVERYQADIVRLIQGDPNPRLGYKEQLIETPVTGEYPGRRQVVRSGSYGIVADDPALRGTGSFTVLALVWPTTPAKGPQGIVSKWSDEYRAGYRLIIGEDGALAFELGDGSSEVDRTSTGVPLYERCWYLVGASFDAEAGTVRIGQAPLVSSAGGNVSPQALDVPARALVERATEVSPRDSGTPLVLGAWVEQIEDGRAVVGGHYNGKLERPRILAHALGDVLLDAAGAGDAADGVVADWDFSAEIGEDGVRPFKRISDRGPHGLHGETVNAPARAMTGHGWSGRAHDPAKAPEQYGAIHFHDDDLDDARWEVDFELTVPPLLRSGVYAARLRSGEHEDYIPFYVRPPRDRATARVAFLAPTNTYLAYGNDNIFGIDGDTIELESGRTVILSPQDLERHLHREYGASTYDVHSDGSGVCCSTWLRPLLTVRPKYRHPFAGVWGFNADFHLLDWLDEKGVEHDVFCDGDLHSDGVELLARYDVVLTGTHPEYYSEAMLDALQDYLQAGGRLMYLGGNGFYWVINYHPETPHMIEVRRWGGTEAWTAQPGEHHLSSTGEMGGIWRNRGRAPQKLVGVGFIGQGFDSSTYYRRMPDSYAPGAAWIFEGVEEEIIGDFGLVLDGAAGMEIDCYDPQLGTPPQALLMASSEDHTAFMLEVRENFGAAMPSIGGDELPHVRADLVYFRTANGGAVFSTGSIAWCGSLSHDGYDNSVSRITENVLKRFASGDELPA